MTLGAVYGSNCPVPVAGGESCLSTVIATFTVVDWLTTAGVLGAIVGFAIWRMRCKAARRTRHARKP
jgi:hypothetical protein